MRKTPLLIALLASACMEVPDPTERHLASAVAPEGAGFIEKVNYTGTGCDDKSASSGFSPDKQVVTSIFSAFVAAKGGATPPEEATRNCLVMMEVNVPAGWQYSVESLDYRGFAGLEGEVTASRKALFMISGSPVQAAAPARFKGGLMKDHAHPQIPVGASPLWSACGGGQVLWVVSQIEVDNSARPSRGGQLTVDSIDTELQWRRCP
jgi:Domain of unknown function (DUF4360)